MVKKKKNTWFVKIRGSYIPNSWQGWLLYIPFVSFLILVLQTAVRTLDSVSDMLYMIFPQFVCAAVVMTWIASHKS